MLDGASRIGDVVATAAADGQPAVGITDHGNMYGVLDLYQRRARRRHQAGHRHRGLLVTTSRASTGPRRDRARDLPPHAARRDDAGLPQPHQGLVARVPRRLLPEAPRRLRAARAAPRGAHRHDRLPRRRGVPGAARRATTTRRASTSTRFQDIFGRDTFFVELQDHGLARAARRSTRSCSSIARELARAAARDQRQPLHAPATTPRRTTRCCACRPARRSTTRTASSSTATSST